MAGWRLLLLSGSVAALTGGICVALGEQSKVASSRESAGESRAEGAANGAALSVLGTEQEGQRDTAEGWISQLAASTADSSTGQVQPLRQSRHDNGIEGSSVGPPSMGSTALNTVLLITVIVSVLVCFLLGIFVAFLCFRSMRASAKDGSSSSFPFSQPSRKGQAAQEYHSDEQAQLFNYQSRMAQMHANLKTNRGMTPYASGDEMILVTSNQESLATMDVNPDVILGADGPAQVTSARIVNPVFDSERHGTLSRQVSPQSQQPATPAVRKPQQQASARRASSMQHKKPSARAKPAAARRTASTPEPASSTSSAEKAASPVRSSQSTSVSSPAVLTSCSSHGGGSSSTPSSSTPVAGAAVADAEPGQPHSKFHFSQDAAVDMAAPAVTTSPTSATAAGVTAEAYSAERGDGAKQSDPE